MEACDRHSTITKDKFCRESTCNKLICTECAVQHKDHKIIDYTELLAQIRLAKDKQMIARISGISARKTLLQELEKMLQKLAERQKALQEEAKSTEKEMPKILKAIGNRVITQKEQIAERIHEVSKIINNNREELIDELEKLTTQSDLNFNEPLDELAIRELLNKYKSDDDVNNLNEFKNKMQEINNVISTFNTFNPYEYFRELAKMYENYENIQMEEKNIDSHMKLWTNDNEIAKSSINRTKASLSKDHNSFCGVITVSEISKKLSEILKNHGALHRSNKTLDDLLVDIETLCNKGSSLRRTPVKKDHGKTFLIGKKPLGGEILRPPTGLKEEVKKPMNRVNSKSEIMSKREQSEEPTKDEAKSKLSMPRASSKRELSSSRIKREEIIKEETKLRGSVVVRSASHREKLNDSEGKGNATLKNRTSSRMSLQKENEAEQPRTSTKSTPRFKFPTKPLINLVKTKTPNNTLKICKNLIEATEALNEVLKGRIINFKSN